MTSGPTPSDAPRPERRRRIARQRERGIALILVLGAVTVLTVMLTEFQDDSNAELAATLADRDALKAEYLARSAISLSRLLLASEETIRKAIPLAGFMKQLPVWEYSEALLGAFNDKDATDTFARFTGVDMSGAKHLGLTGGRFEVKIVDEDAKLNVNIAARSTSIAARQIEMQLLALMTGDQYSPLFEQRDRDGQFSDRATVCGAIIDWADADENLDLCDPRNPTATSSGSEDSFYQMLKVPYLRKNAAYDSLEELHLVRGVSDDFWSTFVDPSPNDPKKRVLTVWGQGAVNMNSANPQTLLALVCANAPADAKICTDLNQVASFLSAAKLLEAFMPPGIPIFSSPDDFVKAVQGKGGMAANLFKTMGIEPVKLLSEGELKKAVTVQSMVFSIYADGVVPGSGRETRVRIHAVIDRRGTPSPTMAPWSSALTQAASGASTTAAASTTTTTGSTGSGGSNSGITGANQPDPGGAVVYFREE